MEQQGLLARLRKLPETPRAVVGGVLISSAVLALIGVLLQVNGSRPAVFYAGAVVQLLLIPLRLHFLTRCKQEAERLSETVRQQQQRVQRFKAGRSD